MADKLAIVKKAFFRSDTVVKYLDRKTLRVLGKFGGLVRKTAQRSMRTRKGSQKSGQGKPPFAHGERLLRKLLFYSLERKRKTVVVGPVLLNETKALGIPKLMETGGQVSVRTKKGSVTKRYEGNPFMQPAFALHIPKVAGMYKNKV